MLKFAPFIGESVLRVPGLHSHIMYLCTVYTSRISIIGFNARVISNFITDYILGYWSCNDAYRNLLPGIAYAFGCEFKK